MTEALGLLLLSALSAYVLFGGADFGGGVLEATVGDAHLKKRLQSTLAPVWEANHVWLIAVVVILFVGFPKFYAQGFTRLFLPIGLALLGILLRGTFFTLRKYDPAPGAVLLRIYSLLFRFSSALTPLIFGMIVSGLLSVHPGGVDTVPENAAFASVYVEPWLNGFGLLTGCFVSALFAYLAAIFFYGELSSAADRALVWRRARLFFGVSFVLGGAVLVTGAVTRRVPLELALTPVQIACQLVATAGICGLVYFQRRERPWGMRLSAGAQVLAILIGWFHAQGPVLLRTQEGLLTLRVAAAPPATQRWLLAVLLFALALVIPALIWLYRVFSRDELPASTQP